MNSNLAHKLMGIRIVYVVVAAIVLAYAAFSVYQIVKEAHDLEKERGRLKEQFKKITQPYYDEIAILREDNRNLSQRVSLLSKERIQIDKTNNVLVRSIVMCSEVPEQNKFAVSSTMFLNYKELSGDVFFESFDILHAATGVLGPTYGASWGNTNGDIYPDFMLSNHYHSSKLYQSKNGTGFKDITVEALGRLGDFVTHSSCWADFTADGWEDMLEPAGLNNGMYPNENCLWINSKSHFVDRAARMNMEHANVNNLYCFWWDYNSDGLLDAVEGVQIHNQSNIVVSRQFSNHTFGDGTAVLFPNGLPESDFVGFYYPRPRQRCFAAISKKGNIRIFDINTLPYDDITFKFGKLDLGLGSRTIVDVTFFDMNNDQNDDIILALNEGHPLIMYSTGQGSFESTALDIQEFRPSSVTNFAPTVAIAIADFNNDMIPDIYVVKRTESANAPNVLYLGAGSRKFVSYVTGGGAGGSSLGRGDSVALADFDVDGNMDLMITNGGGAPPFGFGPTQLFRNTNLHKNNWVEVDLFGVLDNPHGIGALVTITAGTTVQSQIVGGAHSFKSQHHRRLHFGLGSERVISNLSVWWPKAHFVQEYSGITANQLVSIAQVFSPNIPQHAMETLQSRGAFKMQCEEGKTRLKPSFLILGIWKAGTSSLALELSKHPEIKFPTAKETFYFSKLHGKLDINWYWNMFPCGNDSLEHTFEATAGYLYADGVPALVKQYLPNAKFIIMLRDPVERAYSHFYMNYRAHGTNFTLPPAQLFDNLMRSNYADFLMCIQQKGGIEKCANDPTWQFLNAGLYYYSIKRWFEVFPQDQFMIMDFSDFVRNNQLVMHNILKFLNVREYKLPQEAQNIADKKDEMLESTRTFLRAFYAQHNKKLYELLNRNFKWDNT
eukprot:Phypoly_transcript_02591.p1 GENE.Phypoly_transcript_02591~~Phypoly_transcript_02591.p1  ORF type:complete len:891 (+),score=98.31 Phypoly_transcript_02591:80-2752(+)